MPSQAVQTGQQGSFVFVVQPDMKAEIRPVVIGESIDNQTVVTSGLKPGETVVTDGQLRLIPGATVTIKSGLTREAAPRHEYRRSIHSPPGDDDAEFAGDRAVRPDGVSISAGERSAQRRFSDDRRQRRPAGRQSRDDGVVGRDAARKAVLDDCRPGLDDLDATSRAGPTSRCNSISTRNIDAAAQDVQAAIAETQSRTAARDAESAVVSQS